MKPAHALVYVVVPLDDIRSSPENTLLYKPVTPDDPETITMAESIKENGILEPIKISTDYYIISGHRRHCAARMAGLKEVPCLIQTDVKRGHGKTASPEFLKLLREHNRQRIKTRAELLKEELASIDPVVAYEALSEHRRSKAKVKLKPLDIQSGRGRDKISEAKKPFLEAIKRVITKLEEFLPVTVRQIHYQLLNDPPLIHAAKRSSRYRNTPRSYGRLIDLVTRARYEGLIDFEVIHDPTRPVTTWIVYPEVQHYYQSEMRSILQGYSRDLLQSQPHHIEVVVEKSTLHSLIQPVADKFRLPLTIGRGQCTTRPLYDLVQRYHASGKDKLLVLAVSDLDPDGDAIAHSIGKRLRYDYEIESAEVFKIALTMRQVRQLRLSESYVRAKRKSPNYQRYKDTYNTNFVWELEAVPPVTLQRVVTQSIDKVIDKDAFNHEVTQERQDAHHIAAVRNIVVETLQTETTGLEL